MNNSFTPRMSSRWPRCGSATAADAIVTVESLRRGLQRAENPSGVLRGRTRPPPPVRVATSRSATAAAATSSAVSISGATINLLPPSHPSVRAPPRPLVPPPDRKDRLRAGRANAIIKFRGNNEGSENEKAPVDWCCAICLRPDWHQRGLSRLPRCQHVFHTLCVDKVRAALTRTRNIIAKCLLLSSYVQSLVTQWFERASLCPYCRVAV